MQRYIINPNPLPWLCSPASLENYWRSFFKLCWSLLYTCKYDGVCIIRNILSYICCMYWWSKGDIIYLGKHNPVLSQLGKQNCLHCQVWPKPLQLIIWPHSLQRTFIDIKYSTEVHQITLLRDWWRSTVVGAPTRLGKFWTASSRRSSHLMLCIGFSPSYNQLFPANFSDK